MWERSIVMLLVVSFVAKHTVLASEIPITDKPKNVVLVIGDGMGLVHVACSIYGEKEPTAFEKFPVVGLQKTSSFTHLVTDSGAAATAIACGHKTYNSAIGMQSDTTPCTSLMEYAENAGKSTGIIVTSSLAHATPGAFVGHQRFRGFREGIAADYLNLDIDYIVGGGLMYFTQRFTDSRNLLTEFEERGYTVATFDEMPFKRVVKRSVDKLLYITSHSEPPRRIDGRDYFPMATAHGLQTLHRLSPDNGFFLVLEGSQIDFAGHDNNKDYLRVEMQDFNEALEEILAFAMEDGETLVVVTADHSTGGLSIESGRAERHKIKTNFGTSKHTADMVPVFAYGPGSEAFTGIYENTEIFAKIRSVADF